MPKAIKAYWLGLEPRERLILSVGGVVVAVILFYALVWQPWQKSITSMEKSIQTLRSDLVWVRQHAPIIKSGGQGLKVKQQGQDQSLLSVVESTAKKNQLNKAIQQMVPTNDDQVRVVLEDARFNNWVKWIDDLSLKYGVNVEQVNANRDDDKANIAEIKVTFVR